MPEPAPFAVDPANVDPELTLTVGPPPIVPVLDARSALHAAKGDDPVCGAHVIA